MSRPEVFSRPTIPTWDDCAEQLLRVGPGHVYPLV